MERMGSSESGIRVLRKLWEDALPAPEIRSVDDMRSVLANPKCPLSGSLYLMFRDLFRNEKDRSWLSEHHLRYDITVIPPGVICGEYVKTKGHFHPTNPLGVGYPEIYEVLSGKGHYLLQWEDLDEIRVITASKGEKVLIPPGYGHVSINPSSSPLVMANLVSIEFSSNYDAFVSHAGAAYYEMENLGFVPNPRYKRVPPLFRISHGNVFDPVLSRACLYDLIGDEDALLFLNHPERFARLFMTE